MKMLVTGGAGFIGSNFVRYWLKKYPHDELVNLDKLTYAGNLANLKEIENYPNYTFVRGDIVDRKLVNALMKGVKLVVHFAAETHVDRSILHPQQFLITNVLGTQILLEAALKNKVKHFHHVSTDEVFGSLDLTSKEKFNEHSPYRPNSPYAASKAGSDCFVRAYAKTYGLSTTITNTSNNFGPYMYPEKLIPLAITNLIEGEQVPIHGDGKNIRDWLYVIDHCRAIDLAIHKGRPGETYCIGGNGGKSILEIVKAIMKIMGKSNKMIRFVKDRPGNDRRYALDYRKAKRELGYKPLHQLEEYLEETVAWYIDNPHWWKPLKSKEEYKRYYQIQIGERNGLS